MSMSTEPWEAERGCRSLGAGVRGCCELPNKNAENQTSPLKEQHTPNC